MLKAAFLLVAVTAFISAGEIETIVVGDKMPGSDIALVTTEDEETNLAALVSDNGLLVIFSCNTCPFVVGGKDSEGWEGRYNQVTEMAQKHGVATVLVNSNEAKRDAGDSLEDMKQRKVKVGLTATYVLDKASKVADAFGARTTPHVFLFNSDQVLVYTGAIDDNVGSAEEVEENWLENAIQAMASEEEIDPATTRNSGCSIKRVKE